MSLLNELEKKTIGHPVQNLDFSDKGNYLKALAFFIHIDDVILEEEKFIFNEIIESLECEDIKDDLFDFLKTPSLEEYDEIFSLFSNNIIKDSYIMDCSILSYDVDKNKYGDFTFNEEEATFLKYVFEDFSIDFNFISQEYNKYFTSMIRRKKSFCERLLEKKQKELELKKRKVLEEERKKALEEEKRKLEYERKEQKELELKKRKALEEERKKALEEEKIKLELEKKKQEVLNAEKRESIEKERKEGVIGFIMIIIMVAGYYFFSWKGVGISFIIMVIVYMFFEKYIENDNKDNENE